SVTADGTVTIDQAPTHGVFVSGARTGQQTSVSNIPTLVGRLSSDRNSITFATFNTGIETVTRLLPDGSELVEALRICHRERTAVRIGRGGQGDD
ncbi:MAG TPA: hypothetical protein VK572_06190, partial [Burkholderiales bacterium]|nr:hypothetical protein [Burkholderiales bacterium]